MPESEMSATSINESAPPSESGPGDQQDSGQPSDTDAKRRDPRAFTIGIVLSVVIGLTLWNSQLVGDEIFVLFQFTNELAESPRLIWEWAFQSARGGWDTGRFSSPVAHLLSNTGVYITAKTASFLSVDLTTAYSLWRLILICITTVLGIALVASVWARKQLASSKKSVMALAAVLVPATMVSNQAFSSNRITIWSYSIIFIFALSLMILFVKLPQWAQRTPKYRVAIQSSGAVALGLLFGTSYELTQVLFPVALLAYWTSKQPRNPNERWTVRTFARHLVDYYAIIFAIVALGSLLLVRIPGYLYCKETGCYGAAEIGPSASSASALLGSIISPFPPLPQLYSPDWQVPWATSTAVLIFGMLFAVFLIATFLSLRNLHIADHSRQATRWTGVGLAVIGASIIFVIALGLSSSSAVIENIAELWNRLGASGRGTLYTNFGVALFILGLCLIALASFPQKTSRYRLMFVTIIVLTGALGAGSGFANLRESRYTSFTRLASFHHLAATELRYFDTSAEADRRRCNLVKLKITELRNWDGHDRSVVNGLYRTAERQYGQPFCSIPQDKLFDKYYVDPNA